MQKELVQAVVEAVLRADRNDAAALLGECAERIGSTDTLAYVLEPALELIGDYWNSSNSLSLAQAYVAAKIAEDFLVRKVDMHRTGTGLLKKGPVVLGNIEDDFHSLGRDMVRIFLASAGWRVIDLGNDVPAADFVDAAIEHGAKIVGASAMMYSTAVNIVKLREEIDRRFTIDRPILAVGGAVFKLRPELIAEVGGEASAENAIQVPPLFDTLCGYSS